MKTADGPHSWSSRLLLPAVDLSLLGAIFLVVPSMGELIFARSPLCHFFLLPGFFLTVAGIAAIRQVPRYSLNESRDPSILAACLVFFMVIIYSMLYVEATNLGGNEKSNEAWTIGIFFAFLLFVLGGFYWPVRRAQPHTGKALAAEAVGLFSVNYLTVIGAAVWDGFSSQPQPPGAEPVTGWPFVFLFLILYFLFLAFFGLPRLYLLRATGDRIGLAFYLVGVAIFLWNKVPPMA